ncbi:MULTISPECIES: dTDP-4-dehydrorhamnose 3,5-epimerase [Chelativorans]|jgi:dTDP-4-dehydrorhamnose 3,5-epimerase|uniref:dTDP-4-dehydrorhamnose 3,5-epimerase n=1 Tax=Chelativorans sp. (strain BNC1) TaxID=266779 RepID=Q11EN7_CHESB|nr:MULTISPECIES: dTDP-4-dehydrorhamnose 3,5-epimerase [Chelativorans]
MPEFRTMELEGVQEILPEKFSDERGFFSETYNAKAFAEAGIAVEFVQDNHSLSSVPGTVRGLHFQKPPFAQDKLVRVVRGAILDVAVDIRAGSPTFGRWVGVELSSRKWNQLFIPKGYAHGFMTLEPDTEVVYKVSAFYSREHDQAIRFDDPAIGIAWPKEIKPLLSGKDRAAPDLAEVETGFRYGEGA